MLYVFVTEDLEMITASPVIRKVWLNQVIRELIYWEYTSTLPTLINYEIIENKMKKKFNKHTHTYTQSR